MAYTKKVVDSFYKNGFNISLLNTECNDLSLCFIILKEKEILIVC